MDTAVLLMKVGAGLSLLSLVTVFFLRDEMEKAAREAVATSGGALDAGQVSALVGIGMGVIVILGLLGVGLWLWMASANGQGKSWARIVATVLFGLHTLSFASGFSQPGATLSRVLSIAMWLLAAYVIILIYKRESSDYYAARSGPRV